jgi:hypothetical protein
MDHYISSHLQGLLKIRRHEGVVDYEPEVVPFGGFGNGLNVTEF